MPTPHTVYLENRTAVCCTNGVTFCKTLTWVCRSDKLRLVLNGGYAKKHAKERFYILYISKALQRVMTIDLLAQSAILLRLPPLQRRAIKLYS